MTPDPYPDLSGTEAALGSRRTELSEADSRLLALLCRPGPPVVTAVEDELRTARAEQDGHPVWTSGRRGPLTPVFREPSD